MFYQFTDTPDPIQGAKASGSTSKVTPKQLKQTGKANIVKQFGIHWIGCVEDLNDTPYPSSIFPGEMVYPIPHITHRFRASKAFFNHCIVDPEITDGFTHSLLDVEISYGSRTDGICAFEDDYDSGCLTVWCAREEEGSVYGIHQSPWNLTREDMQAIIACIPNRVKPQIGLGAYNIEWDTDDPKDLENLPRSIHIPLGITSEEEISEYITRETGFCHKGFQLHEVYQRHLVSEEG